jgi:hypothetical protein
VRAVKKIREYLEHAAECREMARLAATSSHAEQLENMAATWEQLADSRKRQLAKAGITEEQAEAAGDPLLPRG